MRIFILLIGLTSFLFSEQVDPKLKEHFNFLQIYENIYKTRETHYKTNTIMRELKNENNVNIALKPLQKPLNSFDRLLVHPSYSPLNIIIEPGYTITYAKLAGVDVPKSHNTVDVTIDTNFTTGKLDIKYFKDDTKKGYLMSIFLDNYSALTSKQLRNRVLYTQVKYFEPKILSKAEIIQEILKPQDYEKKYSEIEYMGKIYKIWLISIKDNYGNVQQFKDNKYINAHMLYNNKTYAYQVISGEVR